MRKLISCICGLCLLCVCLMWSGCAATEPARESTYVRSDNDSISVALVDGSVTPNGLTIEITNHTDEEITYGMEFAIEQQREGKWYEMDIDQYFQALGVILDANGANTFNVRLDEPLKNGHYRVIKEFWTSSGTVRYDVEFTI